LKARVILRNHSRTLSASHLFRTFSRRSRFGPKAGIGSEAA
jgi:hypothetical protein